MTIGENVSNVNQIVIVHTDNNVTEMFAELLSIVPVIGVDVLETVDTDTEFGRKPEMQVLEATMDAQQLVTGRIAIPSGHHVRMDGAVVETMDVLVDFVIGENVDEHLNIKTLEKAAGGNVVKKEATVTAFVEEMQNAVVTIIGTPTKMVAKGMEVQVSMHVQQYIHRYKMLYFIPIATANNIFFCQTFMLS